MGLADEAANVGAPLEGNIIQINVTVTATLYTIPTGWHGVFVRAKVFGDTPGSTIGVDLAFGDSSVAVAYNTDSGGTPPAITIDDTTGEHFETGWNSSFIMPGVGDATSFSVVGNADGKLQLIRG